MPFHIFFVNCTVHIDFILSFALQFPALTSCHTEREEPVSGPRIFRHGYDRKQRENRKEKKKSKGAGGGKWTPG